MFYTARWTSKRKRKKKWWWRRCEMGHTEESHEVAKASGWGGIERASTPLSDSGAAPVLPLTGLGRRRRTHLPW